LANSPMTEADKRLTASRKPADEMSKAQQNSSTECFFVPPKGWDLVDPSTYSRHVKIAFLKSGAKHFSPSINLAIEETDASLADYLKAVKGIHERDRKNQWRALGKVRTVAGLAQLTEIDSTSDQGAFRMLQLILVKDKHAYILTASALKEDFSDLYKEFQSAFRSLTLTNDLFSAIPQLERKENLKTQQQELIAAWERTLPSLENPILPQENEEFQKAQWTPFEKGILEQCQDMGAHWQLLMLRSTQEKLLNLPKKRVE
ncbi:MAG: hypothetical protein V4492_08865, partial [Chlamydiota bacterium]